MTSPQSATAPWPRDLSRPRAVLLSLAAAVACLGVGVLPLLLPPVMHLGLDLARSGRWLGLSRAETHALSDRTVAEMVVGPGTFAFGWSGGPRFFDPSESSHLQDARTLFLVFLALVAVSLIALVVVVARRGADPRVWRAVGRGGLVLAALLLAAGLGFLVAFDVAFELFHRLFFPQGNWAFDPSRQRMVQLYPIAFWQYASAALVTLSIAAGLALWAIARARRSALERSGATRIAGTATARGTDPAVTSAPPAR